MIAFLLSGGAMGLDYVETALESTVFQRVPNRSFFNGVKGPNPPLFSYSLTTVPTMTPKCVDVKSSGNDFGPAIQWFSDLVLGIHNGHCLTMK